MFDRGAEDGAVGRRAETGIHDDTEQKLGTALTDKELPAGRVHEDAHVFLRPGDDANQFMRPGVVATLIVRNGGIGLRGVDDAVQGQWPPAFSKNTRGPCCGQESTCAKRLRISSRRVSVIWLMPAHLSLYVLSRNG